MHAHTNPHTHPQIHTHTHAHNPFPQQSAIEQALKELRLFVDATKRDADSRIADADGAARRAEKEAADLREKLQKLQDTLAAAAAAHADKVSTSCFIHARQPWQ